MKFLPRDIPLKNGRTAILRSAEAEDAADMITYLKTTCGETPFLLREPDEIQLTLEDEIRFIETQATAERSLLLLAEIDGEHAGNASLLPAGPFLRERHRCEVGIALYQKYCGLGLGRAMLNAVLRTARELDYEQAELHVVSNNANAIALYRSLGFTIDGTLRHSMKYSDGSYADDYLMRRNLSDL